MGGGGEKLLNVVAEFADGYNTVFTSPEECMIKMNLLRKFCKELNRSYEEIEKSWVGEMVLGEDPQEISRKVRNIQPDVDKVEDFSSKNVG
ncbi:MAG: hypothetical protein ACUVTL_11145 [Thermoproteota archaeon]